MRFVTALGIAATCIASQHGGARADVIFSDTEFITSNWGSDLVNIGAIGSMTASQVTGGNPGFARRVDQTPGANIGDTTYALHRYGTTQATRYDPVSQGAIASLSFSIDFRENALTGNSTHQMLFVGAKQGQVVFIGPGIDTHTSVGAFTTFTTGPLTAAAFTSIGASAAFDLSATGQPIRFGFVTRTVNDTGSFASQSDYDNWSVHITQVPAPASLSLLGIAGLLLRRRS